MKLWAFLFIVVLYCISVGARPNEEGARRRRETSVSAPLDNLRENMRIAMEKREREKQIDDNRSFLDKIG